jgi:hypothetical protein
MGISTAQSLPDYLPKDGLVGWWPFNGNAKDESGNGHDGVVNGVALTTDRFGNLNEAYEWKSNGNVGQYISIGAMASNFPQKSFSFSAWVLADVGQGANPRIVNFGNVYPGIWSMGVSNSSRNYSGFWPPTGGFFYSNPVTSLSWNHLVYTTDATTGSTSFYVNGILDTTFCCSSPDPTSSINGIWEFGKMKPTEIWGGKLDDIGIWNRALTEEEVKQLYVVQESEECKIKFITNKDPIILIGDSIIIKAEKTNIEKNKYSIGDTGPGGGLVFFNSGDDSANWQYMEVTKNDNGFNQGMGCYCTEINGTSSIIGSGLENTENWKSCSGWAKEARQYNNNGLNDWFVPSIDELNEIYQNLHLNGLGNFNSNTQYWSSTPGAYGSCGINGGALVQNFQNGNQYGEYRPGFQGAGSVRWVRRFSNNHEIKYLWSNGETSQSINVSPEKTTKYYVTITMGDENCIDSLVIKVAEKCLPSNIPTANLIAAWPFCGNLKDVSGRGHHGKVKTGTETYTADRHGNENQALLLDGQTYIEVPHNEAFNGFPFSVSAWVKTESKDHQHVINKYSSAAWNGWSLWTQSHGSGWYLRSRTNAMISQYDDFPPFNTEENYSDNQWHLLTFTVDDSLGYIYYDGILQDTQVWRGTPGKCTSGFPIRIGFYAGDNVFYKGAVDDIAVWDRRLTDEEIKNLCDKKPSSDLTVYMDTLAVSPSQEVVMPVNVKNFKDLISAQFSLRFDPKFLKFKGVENSILNPDVADLFGLSQVSEGLIGFAWSDINLQPQTLTDGTALFNVRFELVPGMQGGDLTFLNIVDVPIDIEFMNGDLEVLDRYELGTGIIKIMNGLSMQAIILTEDGKAVPAATVQISGHAQMNVLTNREGRYHAMLDRNRNFTFTPDKVNDSIVTNGITVADVMRIKRHILRTHLLESPYKIIAADVNSDQKVTLADVNFILAMLRGELNIFPNGKLWKFVPRNHTFSDVTNPFPYPSSVTTPSLSEIDNLDFIGIKMGDVDNNYDATHTRSGRKEVGFHLNQTEGINGQTITIPVKVSGFDHVSGFQFALQWDPAVLSFRGLSEDHRNQDVILGTKDVKQGTLRVFWTESKGESILLKDGDAIIHLSFVITGDAGDISNLTFAKLKDMPVEAINDEILSLPVVLESGKISVIRSSIADIDGVENTVSVSPNPVLYESWISISSALDEAVSIQVYDASGKVASESRHTVAKGNTTLPLDLPLRAGMYLVRVHHADGSLMQDIKVIKL